MRQIFSFLLVLMSLAASAIAQDVVPERRLIISEDTDFYGSDLQALFDTTRAACTRACLTNAECKAYTFNTRSNACFPKSAVSERQEYEGAISAEVLASPAETRALAQRQVANLDFLSPRDLRDAYDQAAGLGSRHPGGKWTVQVLMDAVADRRAKDNLPAALHWQGAALAVTDSPAMWLDYARLSLSIKTERGSDRRRNVARAQRAALNAYLRSDAPGMQVTALQLMADTLEELGRGRDTIHVLRLAERIQPRPDIVAALDAAIGKYGFRIVNTRVDSDQAAPRICAEFSEPLIKAGTDYAPYVGLTNDRLAVEASGSQVCVSGVEHGARYQVTFRQGLPSASGEALIKDVALALYVRDRTPSLTFPGRAYVLPRTADAGIPIETVNLETVDLRLRRVSDRNLLRAMQDSYFGRPLSAYADAQFAQDIGEEVWTGTGAVQMQLNQTMTTRLPMGAAIDDLPPGVYALSARVPGADPYDDRGATQWFVLSDLGITTLNGTGGLHVVVRGLGAAQPKAGAEVTLISRANRVLATARTDDQGHARFEAGLARGTAGAAPALVTVQDGDRDMAFLSLTDPAFDLADRGVEGRPPAPPIDVFLTTDRGAYRAGETIYATALARDGRAKAIQGLPLTAIVTRPDGVEYARHLSAGDVAGGHVFSMPTGPSVPRGTWRIDLLADVDDSPLASTTVLVEDFLPERIDFDLALPGGILRATDTPPLQVSAKYLFGAPGADLPVAARVTLHARDTVDGFAGYRFGRHDAQTSPRTEYLPQARTDAAGNATLFVKFPAAPAAGRPLEARILAEISEGSGRPVERQLTRALAPASAMIGIKPGFDDVVPEGSQASFQIIGLSPALSPQPMQVRWQVNRVRTRYQWYQQYGSWNWEPVTTRTRIAEGEAALASESLTVAAPVEWGQYEVVVERLDGAYVASSLQFYAGWYAPADASATPDTVDLSLDKPAYRPGDTATLRLAARDAGTALVTVLSNRVILRQEVSVQQGENRIPVAVTEDWGAGAYVTAQVIRPMDAAKGRNPARALGLVHAQIDPGDKQLAVQIDTAPEAAPRGPLTARVRVEGAAPGDTAYVTVAAVDVGILNLTGFSSPDPSAHYFGQRRLGVEIRDLYGRLINGLDGAMGQVRSGGDAGPQMSLQSPPPTEELVAYFSGPVTVGPDGTAPVAFDLPAFNGTVRLMAVAWSETGVGEAEAEVLVRDPVVVTASLPRFLAPGDQSRLLLEIVHARGPAGRMPLTVAASGLTVDAARLPAAVTLAAAEKVTLTVPVSADMPGDHRLTVTLTTPDGTRLVKDLTVPVRANDPEIATTRRFQLGAGDTFRFDAEVFAGLRAGTGSAMVSAGPLARFDAPGLIAALDRYPYGCTEQVTSRAMPLLYLSSVAEAIGLGGQGALNTRIDQSIERILTRQSANGAFGIWRADTGDMWLDAYVTDFLSRARSEGHLVPDLAFRNALDNLRNQVNYAPDFDKGGEGLAFALMVLAREGSAAMGDLRYYADEKQQSFATPLAAAQLGAALAMYGDQRRADVMFGQAVRQISGRMGDDDSLYRADYGTNLRDAAGLLTLAVEHGSQVVDRQVLATRIGQTSRGRSTQEQAWSLLAANAMIRDPGLASLRINGAPLDGPFARLIEDQTESGPLAVTNAGSTATDVTLTTFGVPDQPVAASGYGYTLTRKAFTTEGAPMPDQIRVGDRFVVVLTISPAEAGQARLMVNDPLPAGFEIDNPNLLRAGDVRALDWLKPASAVHSEFRSDRFLAAVNKQSENPITLAYVVRAVSPGTFHHPAATVEDMYLPQYRARTASGRIGIQP